MPGKSRLIIVGGSAAGPNAAAKAKRVNKDLEVMIFEKGDFVSYGS
jgi:flavin-dependent dehydrogenase